MGYKQDKNTPPMERELIYLLYDLCVDLGFCMPPNNSDEISKQSHHTASGFATLILEAEGMNPEYEAKWASEIAQKFRERFGVEEISKTSFTDKVRD